MKIWEVFVRPLRGGCRSFHVRANTVELAIFETKKYLVRSEGGEEAADLNRANEFSLKLICEPVNDIKPVKPAIQEAA